MQFLRIEDDFLSLAPEYQRAPTLEPSARSTPTTVSDTRSAVSAGRSATLTFGRHLLVGHRCWGHQSPRLLERAFAAANRAAPACVHSRPAVVTARVFGLPPRPL